MCCRIATHFFLVDAVTWGSFKPYVLKSNAEELLHFFFFFNTVKVEKYPFPYFLYQLVPILHWSYILLPLNEIFNPKTPCFFYVCHKNQPFNTHSVFLFSTWPHRWSCDLMGGNLCSQVRNLGGFRMRCSAHIYGCDVQASTYFWP